jgi:hypothetical protein
MALRDTDDWLESYAQGLQAGGVVSVQTAIIDKRFFGVNVPRIVLHC